MPTYKTDYRQTPWALENHARACTGHVIKTGDDGKPQTLAKLVVVYPVDGAGRLRVALFDSAMPDGKRWSYATASGYGYDKLGAALAGMTCGGIPIGDHSDHAGRKTLSDICYQQGWLYLAP